MFKIYNIFITFVRFGGILFEADCSCDIPPNLTNVIKILYILKGYSVNEIKT